MPFQSTAQQRFAFGTSQPWAKRWAAETDFSSLPAKKDAGTTAGSSLHGPGGLLATPGMGSPRKRKGRKWGMRTKAANYAARAGETIAGNLVRGNDGKFSGGGSAPAPKARKGRGRTPKQTTADRQSARDQVRNAKRQSVIDAMANGDQGLAPNIANAMLGFADGGQLDPAIAKGLASVGLVEMGSDGQPRLTASGRMAATAMNRGDVRGALDAIGRGSDRAAASAAKPPKAGKGGSGKGKKAPAVKQPTPAQQAAAIARTQRQAATDARRQAVEQRRQARDSQRSEQQQRQLTDLAQRLEAGNKLTTTELQRMVTSGLAQRNGNTLTMTAAGHRQARRGTATKAAGSPGDYLVVEDPAKSSTWHLQVKRSGTPDHGLMGAAWAALHGGYRGNAYQGPQKAEALAKLKRLYAAEKMELPSEKSFTVFKDSSGRLRWITRTTTAYRDRDDEIISTKSLINDADRMTRTGLYGPLRYWHIGQPQPHNPHTPWGDGADVGMCDFSTVIGRTAIESGTFKSEALGQAVAAVADQHEVSPGFFHPPTDPDPAGVFHQTRRFERSLVPVRYARASNLFTGLTIKEQHMDPTEMERRFKAMIAELQLTPDQAASVAGSIVQAEKSATDQQIAYKSDDAPPVFTAPDGTMGIIADGRFVALKAAAPAPPMDAEDDPALGGDSGADEAAEGEPPLDASAGDGQYIGDMSPDEFKALLAEVLAPVLKVQDMLKQMGDMHGELKGMMGGVATKDNARAAEIASLKERLAALEGDLPAQQAPPSNADGDIAAALKGAPRETPVEGAPVVPNDPSRPLAAVAAQTFPQLYGGAPAAGPWNGWGQPPLKP